VNPTDIELARLERAADRRELETQQIDLSHAGPGFDVSRGTFFRAEIAVELAQ
jgi:hypothetical protein